MTQAAQTKPVPKWMAITDEGVTVTLKYPLEVDGVKTDKLFMRPPCLRDMRAASASANGDPEDREMAMFCSLTSVGERDFSAIKMLDYNRVQAGYFRLVKDDGL